MSTDVIEARLVTCVCMKKHALFFHSETANVVNNFPRGETGNKSREHEP